MEFEKQRSEVEALLFERVARDMDSIYRRAIEAAGAVPYVRDHRTERFAFLSDGILELSGYTVEEMTPKLWDEIGVRSVMQGEAAGLTVEEAMARSRSGQLSQWRCDTLIRCKSGEERWIAETSVEVSGPEGAIGAVGILVDVTDRKRAVDALVESERNLKEAQRLARMGSWTLDLQEYRLVWSDEIYRIFEVDPERYEASYEVFQMRVHPDDRVRVHAAYRESVEQKRPYEIVHRLLMEGGGIRYVQERGETRYASDGRPLKTYGTVQDITERVRDSQRLGMQNEILGALTSGRSLTEVLDVLCLRIEHDHEATVCFVTQSRPEGTATVVSGPSLDPVLGRRFSGRIPGEEPAGGEAEGGPRVTCIADAATDPRAEGLGKLGREAGLRSFWSVPIVSDSGLFGSLVVAHAVARQPTEHDRRWIAESARLAGVAVERHRVERALAESEAHFRTLADSGEALIWTTDVRGACDYFNLPWLRFTGRSLGLERGDGWLEGVHSSDREACIEGRRRAIARREAFTLVYRLRRQDGEYRWLEDHGTPRFDTGGEYVGHIGHCLDVTLRLESERQANRSQRLEAIGQLAGGVAHDLNNALAPILMTTPLLRLEFPEAGELLETVESSAARCAEMVRQLLTFARGVEGERQIVQIGTLAREMERIVRGTFPKNIDMRTVVAPVLRPVLGDPTQIHQVLLNLCVNARDAMPGGGILSIHARDCRIDESYASKVAEARAGDYVLVEVTDTGCGIAPELLDRIFEPFFTTKGPDQGTGLGLSTVVGIVKGHGGFVRVRSEPGKGACFQVHFPAAEAEASAAAPPGPRTVRLSGEGRTVLIVDDEQSLRKSFAAMLELAGFRVLTACDGAEALMAASDHRSILRLVITDLRMPNMDGVQLVRMLRRMLPEVPVIVASGLIDATREAELQAMGIQHRLVKPFRWEALAEAVREALGNARPGGNAVGSR